MTIRECVKQAQREMGWTDEDIEASAKYADSKILQHVHLTYKDVLEGKDREFIDNIKRIMGKATPEQIHEAIASAQKRFNERLKKQ